MAARYRGSDGQRASGERTHEDRRAGRVQRRQRTPIAPVSAFAAVAYPEVDLLFHPQCYRDAPGISPAPTRCARRRSWSSPTIPASTRSGSCAAAMAPTASCADHAQARPGGAAQDLSRLFRRRVPARRALCAADRPAGARADGERHPAAATATRRSRARSAGWRARDRAGLEPGLDGRPAAAFNLSILGGADRHALAARPRPITSC